MFPSTFLHTTLLIHTKVNLDYIAYQLGFISDDMWVRKVTRPQADPLC